MNKNFYEILEVDKNASPEVIEKAYKTLAKKYHPDLQDEAHKKQAEDTLKLINEAYETLSNPILKATYDEQLSHTTISQETYDEMYKQNQELKNELNQLHHMQQDNLSQTQNPYHNNQSNPYINQNPNMDFQNRQTHQRDLDYERQVQQARQKAYHDAYVQDLKNRGYKIRYKKTFSDRVKDLIALLIFIGIVLILWQLPFVKNFFMDIYNNNPLIQLFVNLFKN